MRLFEMFEEKIDEVNMSPGALADFAKSEFAQSMTAGFETELIVPNIINYEQIEKLRKYPNNIQAKSLEQIQEFFLQNERNTPKKVQNVIKTLTSMTVKSKVESYLKKYYPTMLDIKQKLGNLKWPYDYDPNVKIKNKYTEEQVSELIAKAVGMPVKYADGYHGVKRGTGFFILEPDSSIGSVDYESSLDDSRNEVGLELVSPPMPFTQTLEYLDKVFGWANSYGCRTDSSTGFHMGISIPNQNKTNVDYLKFILFLGDEYVLKEFGREDNQYAQAMSYTVLDNIEDIKKTFAKFRSGMNTNAARALSKKLTSSDDKYVSVNIKDNYIEVRSAGGEDYIKNIDKIKLTLMRYVRAMGLAADPEAEKNEYAKKMYKLLSQSIFVTRNNDQMMPLFIRYSTGQITADELTSELQQNRQIKAVDTYKPKAKIAVPPVGQGTEYLVVDEDGKLLHKLSAYSRKDAEMLSIKWLESKNNYSLGGYQIRVVLPNSKLGQQALATAKTAATKEPKAFKIRFTLEGESFTKTIKTSSKDEAMDLMYYNFPKAEIEAVTPIY